MEDIKVFFAITKSGHLFHCFVISEEHILFKSNGNWIQLALNVIFKPFSTVRRCFHQNNPPPPRRFLPFLAIQPPPLKNDVVYGWLLKEVHSLDAPSS